MSIEILKKETLEFAESVFPKIEKKLSAVAERSKSIIPDGVDESGRHISRKPSWWTSGFFGALNLLMYNKTGEEKYLIGAKRSERALDSVLKTPELLHHDVGFMWHILAGANYRLRGSVKSKRRNLIAASILSSRFVLGGNFIRAWNSRSSYGNCEGGAPTDNWTIIDTMMNLPLLYWASREVGDDRFARIAMAHADTTMRTHIRPDGSVIHIVEHDRDSGDVVKTYGGQGYADGSSWTRGQAWAIYGFALSYLHTGEQRYLDTARRVADYFISELGEDCRVALDFRAPKEPCYYDTTAAAISACGMIEIARALGDGGEKYLRAALGMLKQLDLEFANYSPDTDDLLTHCSVRYPALRGDDNPETVRKVTHVSIIYGDFFYTEAILKLLDCEFNPW